MLHVKRPNTKGQQLAKKSAAALTSPTTVAPAALHRKPGWKHCMRLYGKDAVTIMLNTASPLIVQIKLITCSQGTTTAMYQ